MVPDLAARLVIMASYLYYERNSPIVSDGVFDETCKMVAAKWGELAEIRRWQLESPEAILAGGHHVKITRIGENAAIALHLAKMKVHPHGTPIPPGRWQTSRKFGCQFATLQG